MSTDLAPYRKTEKEMASESKSVAEVCAQTMALEVVDDESHELAAEACRYVKAQVKVLEEKRKSVTRPLLAVKREIDSWFKPVVAQWQEAERDLKAKMLDYVKQVQEANRQAAAAAAAAETAEEAVTALQTIADKPQVKGVHEVKRWTYEVIDVTSVPESYLAVDHAEVMAAIKAGTREIPGLRIYQDQTLAVKG